MDTQTLLAVTDFARSRTLAILDTIEKSGQPTAAVLGWRPGPGRAHIAWQAMHCAATHDRYLNVHIKGGQPHDAALVASFAGGSTPSDQNVPDLTAIRAALAETIAPFRDYIGGLVPDQMQQKLANGRTVGESILLLGWHEAHHQGQIHLTWNLYKQAHGVK
jgi:hypothetical protein